MPLARFALAFAVSSLLFGCFGPSDRRPGMHLSGSETAFPADWSFADAHQEIAVEVSGLFGLPHSVTIWCASLDGALYVGARDPESKRWPARVDRDPNVRLRIGEDLYAVRLAPLAEEATLERLRAAYARKYALPAPVAGEPQPPVRYWRVEPRG